MQKTKADHIDQSTIIDISQREIEQQQRQLIRIHKKSQHYTQESRQLVTSLINKTQSQDIKQQLYLLHTQKQQNSRLLKLICIFFTTCLIGFMFIAYKQLEEYKVQTSFRIEQLEMKVSIYQDNNVYLSSQVKNMRQDMKRLQKSIENVKKETVNLLIAQTKRSQRDYHILLRYSTRLKFVLEESSAMIKNNFEIKRIKDEQGVNALQIKKKNQQNNKVLISIDAFPQQQIHYFNVKILQFASLKMISIGVMTQTKKDEFIKDNCVYCQSSKMLYIYSQNGYIYDGQYLIHYSSMQSKVTQLNDSNIITIFVDYQNSKISWCVDSKFVKQIDFPENFKNEKLYAFVDMPNSKDKIIIYHQ